MRPTTRTPIRYCSPTLHRYSVAVSALYSSPTITPDGLAVDSTPHPYEIASDKSHHRTVIGQRRGSVRLGCIPDGWGTTRGHNHPATSTAAPAIPRLSATEERSANRRTLSGSPLIHRLEPMGLKPMGNVLKPCRRETPLMSCRRSCSRNHRVQALRHPRHQLRYSRLPTMTAPQAATIHETG